MSDVRQGRTNSEDGSEIYYEVYRGETAKPTLFFVHGIGGDLDAWQFVRESLGDYPAVALDLRGHGYSTHPRRAKGYALSHIEADIGAVLRAEHLTQVILIGHSGGAVVAAGFASKHKELLRGLVLISSSYCPPAYMRSRTLRALALGLLSALSWISPAPTRGWHSPYPRGKHHKDVEIYGLVRTIYHNSLSSYARFSQELLRIDATEALKSLSLPTLLIAGTDDGVYPLAISEKMHSLIQHSTLEVVEGANHPIILNKPQAVAEAIAVFAATV